MQYSEIVMDHFANPRNVGEIENADGIGEVGNPVCGDMMTFYIKVRDGRIEDVKFKTFGCGAAIAVSSIVSEMAKGKTIEEAESITKQQVAESLGGLPANKMHCSNLGTDALKMAIENYRNRVSVVPGKPARVVDGRHSESCSCPYCVEHMHGGAACKPCSITLDVCPSCGEVVTGGGHECTHAEEEHEAGLPEEACMHHAVDESAHEEPVPVAPEFEEAALRKAASPAIPSPHAREVAAARPAKPSKAAAAKKKPAARKAAAKAKAAPKRKAAGKKAAGKKTAGKKAPRKPARKSGASKARAVKPAASAGRAKKAAPKRKAALAAKSRPARAKKAARGKKQSSKPAAKRPKARVSLRKRPRK